MTNWLIFATKVDVSGLPHSSPTLIHDIIQIVIGVVAALCLLFITIGGLRYILSQGDPGQVAKAKGTILYAVIGLIVVILAQAIVLFVFRNVK